MKRSENSTGLRNGDTNLYRYAFNNPVHHVDPSGNAIPVPLEQPTFGVAQRSFAGDIPWDNPAP